MTDKKENEKVVYTKSTAQLDAEARAEQGDPKPWRETVDPTYGAEPKEGEAQWAVEGNDVSGYRGVSPEYMTYADDTSKPLSGGWTDELAPKSADSEKDGSEDDEDSDGDTKKEDETSGAEPTTESAAKKSAPVTRAPSRPATSKSSDK